MMDASPVDPQVATSIGHSTPRPSNRDRQAELVRAELDALFPSSRETPPYPRSNDPDWPTIPGYEIDAVLGRGGMGIVFRARHARLDRLVALKMALAGAHAGRTERERFQREAEAAALLHHPGIVPIHDVNEIAGQPYLTMEYVEGGTLAAKLTGTPRQAREAARLVADLADAVEAAHRAGIIHRDLKPGNILLTIDGRPKITDFGLARRLDREVALTLSGATLGTPSYMAPEQVRGTSADIGPTTDIYALGAILYELLTGRPPFHGVSSAETIQALLTDDVVPPSRRNPKVPRDLETIVLKSLRRMPPQRYQTAADLRDDLNRFLQGEAIMARPERTAERWLRAIRRRPATVVAALTTSASLVVLIGAGLWIHADRVAAAQRTLAEQAATERLADDDLGEMERALSVSDWGKAEAAWARAELRLNNLPMSPIRNRLDAGKSALTLAARLGAVRLERARSERGMLDFARSNHGYVATFQSAGLGGYADAPPVVAARVRRSLIRQALVDALDDWSLVPQNADQLTWTIAVASQADENQSDWQTRARAAAERRDGVEVVQLVESAPFASASLPLLMLLDLELERTGHDSIPFLRRIRDAHPSDFWANLALGGRLARRGQAAESVRYIQAAEALRPNVSITHHELGFVLFALRRPADAEMEFRTAVRLDPSSVVTRVSLCLTLLNLGRADEALIEAKATLSIAPDEAIAHSALGDSLRDLGRLTEAVEAYRRALDLAPDFAGTRESLGRCLVRLGRFDELRTVLANAFESRPHQPAAWDGYAELCLFLGRENEYESACARMLASWQPDGDPREAERIGRACLLRDGPPEQTERAAALIDVALAADPSRAPLWVGPYFRLAKALAEYRLGHFESARGLLEGDAATVLRPAPGLILSMVQAKQGRPQEARHTLERAIAAVNWDQEKADNRETWIAHILRAEAESLLDSELTTD